MAFRLKKTEHDGPKKGRGFWGRKVEAKHQSSRVRRTLGNREIRQHLGEEQEHGMVRERSW